MVYACELCGFLFIRHEYPDHCPNCNREAVRPATEKEAKALEQRIKVER